MIIGVLCETYPGERRVAVVPASLKSLTEAGLGVVVQTGAGGQAGYPDADYLARGATIANSREEVFDQADCLLQVRTLGANSQRGREDLDRFRSGQTALGLADPLTTPQLSQELAQRGVRLFALELLPRITRAQSMDALSSMATIAGYKAVLLAANTLPRLFPMLMTAAGTITPAKVLVLGAGVAGLQAISVARRLGAVVSAYDVRPIVREQVESVGGKFLALDLELAQAEDAGGYAKDQTADFQQRQQQELAKVIATQDVVITTAAIPGKPAPVLVTAEAVRQMAPGSVIVDLAAERGGNCELTQPDQTISVEPGVTIIGTVNLPALVPFHASQMYSKNVTTLLLHLVKDGQWNIDMTDEIVIGTLVSRNGHIVHPRLRELLGLEQIAQTASE